MRLTQPDGSEQDLERTLRGGLAWRQPLRRAPARGRAAATAMAPQPAPALLLLLLLVTQLLPAQTCVEATAAAATPTAAPDGNSSAGRPLLGSELKAAARSPRPAPRALALLAPLIPLALRLPLG